MATITTTKMAPRAGRRWWRQGLLGCGILASLLYVALTILGAMLWVVVLAIALLRAQEERPHNGLDARTAVKTAQSPSSDPPQWFTNLLKFVLRTSLHGIFSKSIMLLVFRGRKTGRVYRTPVSYLREGNVVTAFTDSPWQHNLLGGASVTVYLKGKAVEGFAEVIDDRDAVTEALTHHLRHVRFDARFYGVSFDADGQPIREQVEKGSRHHVMLKIQLSAPTLSNATQR